MKQKFYAFLLLAFAVSAANAQIYSYTSDTAGNYASVDPNATGIKLTRYNGATRPASVCATGFSSTNLSTATTFATTLPAVEADVTANAGFVLNVTGFSVGTRKSGTGPADVRLAYSTDGGATWTDKGSNDVPGTGSCGSTATATWTTAVTVPSSSSLKFRVYGFGASSVSGTIQILNLSIIGTVSTTDSIFTTATAFGPFCEGLNDTIAVPFTQSGGAFSGLFNVQLSDASGIFPNDATSNIISAGSATSPVTAVIPSTTPWANGYRVRVVNSSPTFYQSGDNGSNITINQSVVPSISISAVQTTVCQGHAASFSASSVSNAGTVTSYQWYVNGQAVSGTSSTFNTYLNNNDSVYATLTSNATCAVPATVASNSVTITVNPTDTTTLFDTLCPGATLSFGSQTLSTTGRYSNLLSNVYGCDSLVVLYLNALTAHNTAQSAAICQGSSYSFNGRTLTTAGTYADTVRCDSIVTLTLSYKTVHTTALSASICQGSSYSFNGATLSTAGTYADTVRCDSIVTLTLSYKTVHTTPLIAAICTGGSYSFNGRTLSTAGTYADTVRCDSIVTLTLSVNALPTVSFNPTDTIIGNCGTIRALVLSGASPAGGTFSGQFVSGDSIYNNGAFPGFVTTVVVTYTYTDGNHCTNSDSAIYILNKCDGISETSLNNSISLYPNPTENMLHIEASNLTGTSTIIITDMVGKVLSTQYANGSSISRDIDMSAFEKGIYLITIRDAANHSGTKQIVKN